MTSSELTLEVTALLASIDNLTEFWPKALDGRPVPLGHSSMPPDVAERISQALSSISGSVAKAAAVLEQTAHGLGHEADVDMTTREAYAKVLSATSFLRDLGVLTPDHAEPVKPPPVPERRRTRRPDALAVLDLDPASSSYASIVGRLEMPNVGDELAKKTGYSRPHTTHCGPDGIYMSALGSPSGDGPGGVFVLDHESFDVKRAWEADRGPQYLAYDFWWHLGQDTLISSEWGTPKMVENGVSPEQLLAGKYGHQIHVWDLRNRKHLQALDLGPEQQMVLELRPSHDPNKTFGFVGVVVSLKDLSASVWLWHRENGQWAIQKVIEIPAEPAAADLLPPALKPFGAVPPLVTDMSSAQGAGLMLFPVILGLPTATRFDDPVPSGIQDVAAVLVHTAAMLATMGVVASVVYERLGVGVLRRAWVNMDAIWAVAVVAAGLVTLFT